MRRRKHSALEWASFLIGAVGLGISIKGMIEANKADARARELQRRADEALKLALEQSNKSIAALHSGLSQSASALECDLYEDRPTLLELII
jgi:hypothetical protein